MFQIKRVKDDHILCGDGEWRPADQIGGLTGHGAKRYKTRAGAAGKGVHLPFVIQIEEIADGK